MYSVVIGDKLAIWRIEIIKTGDILAHAHSRLRRVACRKRQSSAARRVVIETQLGQLRARSSTQIDPKCPIIRQNRRSPNLASGWIACKISAAVLKRGSGAAGQQHPKLQLYKFYP
jgi:hypothetical protein